MPLFSIFLCTPPLPNTACHSSLAGLVVSVQVGHPPPALRCPLAGIGAGDAGHRAGRAARACHVLSEASVNIGDVTSVPPACSVVLFAIFGRGEWRGWCTDCEATLGTTQNRLLVQSPAHTTWVTKKQPTLHWPLLRDGGFPLCASLLLQLDRREIRGHGVCYSDWPKSVAPRPRSSPLPEPELLPRYTFSAVAPQVPMGRRIALPCACMTPPPRVSYLAGPGVPWELCSPCARRLVGRPNNAVSRLLWQHTRRSRRSGSGGEHGLTQGPWPRGRGPLRLCPYTGAAAQRRP